jgi:hypothetical protein
MTKELEVLAQALENAARASKPDDRLAVQGLHALALMRLGEFGPAEDLLMARLTDVPDGPAPSDRSTYLMLASAARLRRGASSIEPDPQSSRIAAERFFEASRLEPGLTTRFVSEAIQGVDVSIPAPNLERALADFFETLVQQESVSPKVYSSGVVGLLRLAAYEWSRRGVDESNKLIATDWEPFLRIADTVASSQQSLRFDAVDEDLQHRWLLWTAIHTAGKPYFLSGEARAHCLERCTRYHSAAKRLLPAPNLEIDLAFASVEYISKSSDEAARSRFVESKANAERGVKQWPGGKPGTLQLIEWELDKARELTENQKQGER